MTKNNLIKKLDEIKLLKKANDYYYYMNKERLNFVNKSLKNAKYKYSFFEIEIIENKVFIVYNKSNIFNEALFHNRIREVIEIKDFTVSAIVAKIISHISF